MRRSGFRQSLVGMAAVGAPGSWSVQSPCACTRQVRRFFQILHGAGLACRPLTACAGCRNGAGTTSPATSCLERSSRVAGRCPAAWRQSGNQLPSRAGNHRCRYMRHSGWHRFLMCCLTCNVAKALIPEWPSANLKIDLTLVVHSSGWRRSEKLKRCWHPGPPPAGVQAT